MNNLPLKSLLLFTTALTLVSCHELYYINPAKLTNDYNGATLKQKAFLTHAKTWQANLDSLTAEMAALPPAQVKAKEQRFLQYRQAIQQKAQAEEARVNQEILAEINAYIKQYGKEKGYDFILGATDNGNP